MKTLLLVIIAMLTFSTAKAQKQDPWSEYMTPNEVHKLLGEYAGAFDMEITMWPDEGKEPAKVKVASNHQMILGGRFLELRQTGKMMGMDYLSVSTFGYNTSGKSFDLITLNNMGTGTLSLTGTWNPEIKEATVSGQMISPGSNKVIKIRQVIHFQDKNRLTITNYDQSEGRQPQKTIEYKLTRKSA